MKQTVYLFMLVMVKLINNVYILFIYDFFNF